jgi:general secretion pathway protein G
MEFTSRRNVRRAGFTLVELLIVLGILVLLLAMVVPKLLGSRKRAQIDAAKTQIGLFRAPLEQYYLDCNQFPSTEQGLEALVTQPPDLPENVKWQGPYVNGNLGNDPWNNTYQYEYPATHGNSDTPDIWSYGPDGEEGTDDDVTSWGGASAGGAEGEVVPGERKPPRGEGPPKEGRKSKPVIPKAIRSDSAEKPRPRARTSE